MLVIAVGIVLWIVLGIMVLAWARQTQDEDLERLEFMAARADAELDVKRGRIG